MNDEIAKLEKATEKLQADIASLQREQIKTYSEIAVLMNELWELRREIKAAQAQTLRIVKRPKV